MRRRLILLSMALSLGFPPLVFPALGFPASARARTILAATPIARMDLPWWRARHEAKLKELAETKPQLIFLGDSITEDWERSGPPAWQDFAPVWKRYYGDRQAINLGFKGDTTASLLWRIRNGEVAGIAPKAAVILIGANNLGRVHWSAEDTVAGIDAIISELHHRLPTTKILLLGVLPSERSAWITETTGQINAMLAKRYKGDRSVSFLDLTALFMRNGRLNRDLFLDPKLTPPDPPLHPTAQGQALMAQAMEPVLADMLNDKPHS
ncbi:MAG TPA: GDSL-type esterase/lipase family protein [Rhodopila sp.]|nr:GDSL-type esterase/lipase family protein [Rhodopila sp.]